MRNHHEESAIRRYLLNQLAASEQEKIELQLLGDESFSEELEFVEDELIDEYLAGELSDNERLSFEETFLTHPERRRKLTAGQALKRYFDASSPATLRSAGRLESLRKWLNRFFFSSPIIVAVAIVLVAVVGFGIWRGIFYRSNLEKGLIALNAAYTEQRPIEARVSNFKHARFITTRRDEAKPVNEIERRRADLFLLEALDENRNADSYHGLGQLYLLQQETTKAIEYLEQARQADPNNPRIYADLGAAYFERGKSALESDTAEQLPAGKGLADLGQSLDYLKQALELDPNLLEALFNRALVHQHQKLYSLAKADWQAYLEKDSTSPWAAEAQQRLKDLEEKNRTGSQNNSKPLDLFMQAYRARDDNTAFQIYKRKQGPIGNDIIKDLIDRFLTNDLDHQSLEYLRALEYLGQLEITRTQDSFAFDLARFYAGASPQTKKLLRQAREQVFKGYQLLSQSRVSDANQILDNALTTFQQVGDRPETLATLIALAHGAAIQPDVAKGLEILARAIPTCEARHYRRLRAQALTHRAHIQSDINKYSEAINDGNRALNDFKMLDDIGGTLNTLVQMASLNLFLNDISASFSYLRRGLEVAEKNETQPAQIWGLHVALSLNLTALKLYRAALDYQNEALQLFLSNPNAALYRSRSYLFIGMTYGFLKRFDLAVENLRSAYEEGKPLARERTGQNMMANAALRLGEVHRSAGDQNRALNAYEESLRLYEKLQFNHYEYAARKGKFLSYIAENNDALAFRELQIIIDLFDQYREKILDERKKNYFFDREQDVYDLAIDFAYSRLGDDQRAFYYSETSRARNLRDLMQRGAEVTLSYDGPDLRLANAGNAEALTGLTAAQVKDQLHEKLQLIQFAVLEKKLLIWHISGNGIFAKSVSIESTQLATLVTRVLNEIKQRDQIKAPASLRELYNLIVGPIEETLDPNRVLCFVPDKVLHYVPFGALVSTKTGHFLSQDFRLLVSPSASILIESTKNAEGRPLVKHERLLAVGNPAFDRKANPNLPNLPSAQWEVEQIAASYDRRSILTSRQATREAVLKELPKADVAHFAAHYEIDPRSNLLSKVLLASEPGERSHGQPSGLHADDIYRMNLKEVRLVVLAGCETGIEQQFGGEGAIGFARSFLVAGVPVVVATLWPVDSEATAKLMVAFHHNRKQPHSTVTSALMRAQQEMMRGSYSHPYYWAGFIVVGGYSEF